MSRPVLTLAELSSRLQPVTRADEQVLAVRPEVAPLFPWGGIRRGSILDIGSRSLCWLTIAETVAAGSWAAVIGMADPGWASLAEHGVELDRVVMIDAPPADVAVTVIAALIDALDVVVVGEQIALRAADLRRLSARVRERGGVLIGTSGWSEGVDLRLTLRSSKWVGLGNGDGVLHGREVECESQGRGAAARPRRVTFWAQGRADGVWADADSADAASTDATSSDGAVALVIREHTIADDPVEQRAG